MAVLNFEPQKEKRNIRGNILRVAAYIRVSSESEEQENSYDTQYEYFTRLLQSNPQWSDAGIYSDYGISGTDREQRTGYKRLLRHCEEEKIDYIICKSISRFARNTSDFINAMNIFRIHDVTIYFEKENIDSKTPARDFILASLAAIAQEESRSISSNIHWGIQKRYPQGHARNYIIYGYCYEEGENRIETMEGGYQLRRICVIKKEADVIEKIFQWVNEGKSFIDIARTLNQKQIPAPISQIRKRGENNNRRDIEIGWTGATISRIVSLERYCGDVLLQKTYTPDFLSHKSKKNQGNVSQYLVRDHHPSIIERKTFEDAQIIKQYNSHRYVNYKKKRKKHPFSGRLICASCGRFYNVRNTNAHPIWYCPISALNNGKSLCYAQKVYEEQLVRMIQKAFVKRFQLFPEYMIDEDKIENFIEEHQIEGVGEKKIFLQHMQSFPDQILLLMENVQKSDYLERNQEFLKKRIRELQIIINESEQRIRKLTIQEEMIERERIITVDSLISQNEIERITGKRKTEKIRQQKMEKEKEKLEEWLIEIEKYMRKLEIDYGEREKTLVWIKKLPRGEEGVKIFLKEFADNHIPSFILEIKIYDPCHFIVHWFDNTTTEVEMNSNVEDFRCRKIRLA